MSREVNFWSSCSAFYDCAIGFLIHAWLCRCCCCPTLSSGLLSSSHLSGFLFWRQSSNCRGLSAAAASQPAGLMSPAFRSCLQTSVYRRTGLPAGLEPVASSPYSMSLRIRPSSMRLTWPNQCKRLWPSKVNILSILACARTFLSRTRSCQVMPRIPLRQRRWKALSLRSWRDYRIHVSLP